MTTGDGIQLADIGLTILTGMFWFVYRGIQDRINKLEEVSRMEDQTIIRSIEKLADLVKDVDIKYRDNDRELYQATNQMGIELARLKAMVELKS